MKDPIYVRMSHPLSASNGNRLSFLHGFDSAHVLNYFENDYQVIAEVFVISERELPRDMEAVSKANEAKDIAMMREAIHKIKASFHLVGLLEIEKEVMKFYDACLKAGTYNELQQEYDKLWPGMVRAKRLICEQAQLFSSSFYPAA